MKAIMIAGVLSLGLLLQGCAYLGKSGSCACGKSSASCESCKGGCADQKKDGKGECENCKK